MMRRLAVLGVALVVAASACSSGSSAETCDEIVDETLDLIQRLIDDVDEEFGDVSLADHLESGDELPSVERFTADAEAIDARAAELGCTQSEISADVDARVGELSATTELGRFLINAIRSGGL